MLGIDAFSGDSVPVHLITRAEMALYVRHLVPNRVIVFQATNRYIDSAPFIQWLAAEQDLHARLVRDASRPATPAVWSTGTRSPDQILMTRDAKRLEHPRIPEAAQRIGERFDLPTFTDVQHNFVRIVM